MNEQEKLILILNVGSTSIKYSLYDVSDKFKVIINGNFQGIGSKESESTIKFAGEKKVLFYPNLNFAKALNKIIEQIVKFSQVKDFNEKLISVGHRIVQGGDYFKQSAIIDDISLSKIKEFIYLAPLHNSVQVEVIELALKQFSKVKHVAIFDTSFHSTIAKEHYLYPINFNYYSNNRIRRYGFHGSSYRFVLKTLQNYYEKSKLNLIVCHVGGDVSCCAIKDSQSFHTSMGYGPLGGCIMATRSGDLDPTIIDGMMHSSKKSFKETLHELNTASGLQGISGILHGDMRKIEHEMLEENKHRATLAFNMFENAIISYISYYYFLLGGDIDAIVLTAGIGENSRVFQNNLIQKVKHAVNLVPCKKPHQVNEHVTVLTKEESKIDFLVVNTDEEYTMVSDAFELTQEQ